MQQKSSKRHKRKTMVTLSSNGFLPPRVGHGKLLKAKYFDSRHIIHTTFQIQKYCKIQLPSSNATYFQIKRSLLDIKPTV